MNKVINAMWKYLDKLKGRRWSVAKIILAIFILAFSAYYLFWRFPSIIKGGERQIDTAFIAISTIIILLPFLSEVELFGVRFKKEIEKAKKEVIEAVERIISVKIKNQPYTLIDLIARFILLKKLLVRLENQKMKLGIVKKSPNHYSHY